MSLYNLYIKTGEQYHIGHQLNYDYSGNHSLYILYGTDMFRIAHLQLKLIAV